MKYKIVSISSGSKTMILRIESTEEVKPDKEFSEVHKYINDLKNSKDEMAKMMSTNLEGMIKYFESVEEKEKRQFKRQDEISIDKQVFKELKINVDDIINLEITKASHFQIIEDKNNE